ncbi:MAG: hypothetical protein GDA42_11710 [Ekhidna sp.]|nr:hypothetical protein [Ekhidna sp.]
MINFTYPKIKLLIVIVLIGTISIIPVACGDDDSPANKKPEIQNQRAMTVMFSQ